MPLNLPAAQSLCPPGVPSEVGTPSPKEKEMTCQVATRFSSLSSTESRLTTWCGHLVASLAQCVQSFLPSSANLPLTSLCEQTQTDCLQDENKQCIASDGHKIPPAPMCPSKWVMSPSRCSAVLNIKRSTRKTLLKTWNVPREPSTNSTADTTA